MQKLGLLSLLLLAAGCGPTGTIATHNTTRDVLIVEVGAVEEGIAAGKTRTYRYSGSPFTLKVSKENGDLVEEVEITPQKGQKWLFHAVGGTSCYGVADFGNLYAAGSDGSLSHVTPVPAGEWSVLERKMDFLPGEKLPIFSDSTEIWGLVEVSCSMTTDAANTHAAIYATIDKLKPK